MENFTPQIQTQVFKFNTFEAKLSQNKLQFEKQYPQSISIQQIKYDDQSVYHGTLVNGKRQGFGEYNFANKDSYKGSWKNDLFQGYGIYKYTSQKKAYCGEFLRGQQHGKGKLINLQNNSIIYDGQWENGLKHGNGIFRYSNIEYYSGNWIKGIKQGTGNHYKDGHIYIGQWFQNKRNGYGLYKNKEGIIFKGVWKSDTLDRGIIQYPTKNGQDKYEGQILRGMRNGKGVYTYSEGGQYKGQYRDDQKSGLGIQKKNGSVYNGNFIKNKRQGLGTYIYANGDKYEGNFSEGKRHGKNGIFNWADGSVFNGTFQKDLMWQGIYIDSTDKVQRKVINGQIIN